MPPPRGLACAPHGVVPPEFPVFSKPITNLRGMGIGSRVLADREDYRRHLTPGHFWMTLLTGEHVSSDVAVAGGRALWWRHCRGTPRPLGIFDYWTVEAQERPQLEAGLGAWIAQHLAGYTGMLNLETLSERIIDAHLRFSDQWPDLYGVGWLSAVVGLYERGVWAFGEPARHCGYSVVLFGPHGREYQPPPPQLLAQVRRMPAITSVQITFHANWPAACHPMPPGGLRLAIVNCTDLDAGRAARALLAQFFQVPGGG